MSEQNYGGPGPGRAETWDDVFGESLFPNFVTTIEKVGKAMLRAARDGAPKSVLENRDINALAE